MMFQDVKSCHFSRQQAPLNLTFAHPEQRLKLSLGGLGVPTSLHFKSTMCTTNILLFEWKN